LEGVDLRRDDSGAGPVPIIVPFIITTDGGDDTDNLDLADPGLARGKEVIADRVYARDGAGPVCRGDGALPRRKPGRSAEEPSVATLHLPSRGAAGKVSRKHHQGVGGVVDGEDNMGREGPLAERTGRE
jgi:hypothetical protein